LALSAAILAAREIQFFAQDAEQAGLRLSIDRVRFAVYHEADSSHSGLQIEGYVVFRAALLQRIIYPPAKVG
jgi:hypothetical protein